MTGRHLLYESFDSSRFVSVRQHLQTPIADTCEIFSKSIANLLPVCVFISLEMVSQTSGITTPLSRESTSGLTIRQLPLTIGSGLGVLDNPHYQMSILGKERKYCGIFWCTFGEKRAIIVRPAIMTSQHDW